MMSHLLSFIKLLVLLSGTAFSSLLSLYAAEQNPRLSSIIQNVGQLRFTNPQHYKDIKFYTYSKTSTVYFFDNSISLVNSFFSECKDSKYQKNMPAKPATVKQKRLDLCFLNAKTSSIEPLNEQKAKINMYHGQEVYEDISSFQSLYYHNLYPKIDLKINNVSENIKYDLIVKPGGDVKDIKLQFKGSDEIINEKHRLLIIRGKDTIIDRIPEIYQVINNKRISVQGFFSFKSGVITFDIADFDKNHSLIIDPEILWSSYLAGNGYDRIRSVEVSPKGDIFVCGITASSDFPVTPGTHSDKFAGVYDWVAMKFDKDYNLVWSTFIGGRSDDGGFKGLLSQDGSYWVAGQTTSWDFPITQDAFQKTYAGGSADGAIVKLDENGKMLFSSYCGSSGYEAVLGLDEAANGEIIACGETYGQLGNITNNANLKSFQGKSDAYYFKIDKNGKLLVMSYVSGNTTDSAEDLVFDSKGNAIFTGFVDSGTDFDPNVTLNLMSGGIDAWVVKIDTSYGHPIWCRFVGGSDLDRAYNICVDSSDNIYISGYTFSADFPVTSAAHQTKYGGNGDYFLTKLNSDGNLLWSTYFGGTGVDGYQDDGSHQGGIACDSISNVYISGRINSGDIAMIDAFQENKNGKEESYYAAFDPNGQLISSSYLGGSLNDMGCNLCVDKTSSTLWIVGMTESRDFPVTDDAFQRDYVNGYDGFITKIGLVIKVPDEIYITKNADKCNVVHELNAEFADEAEENILSCEILANVNCTLTDSSLRDKKVYLKWTVTDPTVQSVFSVHIRGDIELDTVITVTTIPLTNLVQVSYDGDKKIDFGQILFGEILCDSLLIENFDDDSVIIEAAYFLDNTNFSVPPGQLPMFIGPKQSAFLTVCWEASDKPANPNVDTLLIETDCFDFTFPATGEALIDAELNVSFANDSCGILNEMFVEFGNETSEEIVSCEIVSAENCSLVDSAVHVKDVFLKWRIHNPNLQSVFACRIVGKSVLDTVITMVRAPMPAEFELSYNGKTAIDYDSCIIGELICKEVQLTNHSSESIIIDKAFFLGNINFSVPQKQLPIIVAAGETVDILLCWEALDAKVNPYRDTLYVQSECFFALLPAVAQALPYESGGKTVCRQDIKIVQKDIKNGFYDEYYPNPAGGSVAILIGLSESAQVAVEIYNLLGEKIDTKHPGSIEKGLSEIHIDCDSYSSGTYITVLLVNGQKTDTKIFHKL